MVIVCTHGQMDWSATVQQMTRGMLRSRPKCVEPLAPKRASCSWSGSDNARVIFRCLPPAPSGRIDSLANGSLRASNLQCRLCGDESEGAAVAIRPKADLQVSPKQPDARTAFFLFLHLRSSRSWLPALGQNLSLPTDRFAHFRRKQPSSTRPIEGWREKAMRVRLLSKISEIAFDSTS